MSPKPSTVAEYLASLPEDRRAALQAIRKVVAKNIDKRFEEGIQYGMLGWYLPHSQYPAGYHCDPKQPLPFASIASQKNHIGLYLFCIYASPEEQERFRAEWIASGKKLDMGKSCVRVKKLEDVPLDVLARMLKRVTAKKFVTAYEAGLSGSAGKTAKKATAKKATAKKATAKKATAKKATAKKATAKKATAKKTTAKKTTAKKTTAKKATAKKATAKRRR